MSEPTPDTCKRRIIRWSQRVQIARYVIQVNPDTVQPKSADQKKCCGESVKAADAQLYNWIKSATISNTVSSQTETLQDLFQSPSLSPRHALAIRLANESH